MLDMLIQGGRVVTPTGVGDWDVEIVGEQIVAVAFPGILPGAATHVIDARGKIAVPSGIETHAYAVANVQPGARTLVPGANLATQILLVKAKTYQKAVLHTMFAGQRGRINASGKTPPHSIGGWTAAT